MSAFVQQPESFASGWYAKAVLLKAHAAPLTADGSKSLPSLY